MRFARGLVIGIIGFFLWVIASVVAAFSWIGQEGLGVEPELARINPLFSIPLIVGFFLMFLGPLYYWIVEPIFFPKKAKRSYPALRYQSSPTKMSFCGNCGAQKDQTAKFCIACGQKY